MKNPAEKRSSHAERLRAKLAELEELRAGLQAKYDRLQQERDTLQEQQGQSGDFQRREAEPGADELRKGSPANRFKKTRRG